jgi:hypothetical protein
MNIDDFIKLPASEAGWLYRHHRDAGDAEEASRLHQAYFEAHRVRLSDERQIAEAALPPPAAVTAAHPGRAAPPRKRERSKVRLVGALLSSTGLVIGLFAAAAGIGPAGLIVGGGMASSGFALWLVGVLEDRLVSIQSALEANSPI